MYVPGITSLLVRKESAPTLARRRGGGKSGHSSSHSSGSSGDKEGGSTSSSSKSKSSTSTKSIPIGGSSRKVTSYNSGGGKVLTIPAGQPFAGRTQGGGTRAQIWGTRTYGSGYPGYYDRGVASRPFPFYFWPVVWSPHVNYYGPNTVYLNETNEYGTPVNTTRPGGPQFTAAWQSNSTTAQPTTLRVIADNTTVLSLMAAVSANCSAYLLPSSYTTADNATLFALPFPEDGSGTVMPEAVVQYYRASSVALSLDGYNNSAVFAAENSTADTPLPQGIDMVMLNCVNETIGSAVPLVNGGYPVSVPNVGLLGMVFLTWLIRGMLQ